VCQRSHDVPGAPAPRITTQKKSLHASERDTPRIQQARQDYRQQITALDLKRLKFVDESGVHVAMTRLDGRAPAGERVLGSVPQHYGQQVTMLGTLGIQGLHAVMTGDGATDSDGLRPYVTKVLGPTLPPGDLVVLDHWQAHNAVGVQQAIARRGARRLSWPPYSPALSPIAPCWSKLKPALRPATARTRAALDAALAEAIGTVSHTDAWGWFKHCGYPVQ
jgi:transposase